MAKKVSGKDMLIALLDSSFFLTKTSDGIKVVTTEERDLALQIHGIAHMTQRIAKSKGNLFYSKTVRTFDKKNKYQVFAATALGKDLVHTLSADIHGIKQHYPMHTLNPYVEAFIERAEKTDLFTLGKVDFRLPIHQITMVINCLNEFVESIRACVNATAFKAALRSRQRASNKNHSSLLEYINACFLEYSKLLVIRIDLGYLNKHCVSHADNWHGDQVTYPEVKAHREQIVRDLREKMFKDSWVGHAWKLEYGLDKSYHYHMLILLDGEKVCQDVTIAKVIGDHWENKITDGRGLAWNCNAKKNMYRDRGIGMIHYGDKILREGLVKATTYLTKPEYYIRFNVPEGHIFGKGLKPKPKAVKRGRPRKESDS